MFALEVLFKDGATPTTMIFVRRPSAIIGGSSFANVVLEDMKSLNYQLRLIRNIGRSFSLNVLPFQPAESSLKNGGSNLTDAHAGLEGIFEGHRQFDIGPVKIEITAIDCDFILKEGEAPDKAGIRVLRLATTAASPRFPALLTGSPPIVVSFNPDSPIIVGRSRPCAMRIESADISARHARIGYDGNSFWVEDLGSTNGTFIRGVRVAGKTRVAAGENIMIARDCAVVGVVSEEGLIKLVGGSEKFNSQNVLAVGQKNYPALVSLSEVAKPSRLVLTPGLSTKLGREPSSDMWLGAPHISRHHCTVFLTDDGAVKIIDQSTNGTDYDAGRLGQGQTLLSEGLPHVLNFGAGVTVALCFSEQHEKQFKKSKGALASFGSAASELGDDSTGEGKDQVKISDVSKLIGRRGRQATAHHLKALYGSGEKKFRILFWLVLGALILVLGVAFGLLAAIVF